MRSAEGTYKHHVAVHAMLHTVSQDKGLWRNEDPTFYLVASD